MTFPHPTACSRCVAALGYWRPPERLCPTCAEQAASEQAAER